MAVAEARTAWQRAVNRCLVQEDAKRAPKLACCSSASPSSKQVDTGPANGADAQNPSGTCFLPFDRNSSYCDLSPNSRWWLHLQPNYGYQKGLVSELVDSIEAEMENIGPVLDSIPKYNKLCDQNEADSICVDKFTVGGSLDSQVTRSASYVNSDLGVGSKELTDVFTEISKDSPNLEDTGYPNEASKKGLVDLTVGKQIDELSFDTEYPWIGVAKTEPWWRTADTEELALLVAQRSHDFMENCDLPQPQNNFVKQDRDVDVDSKIYASSMGPKAGSMRQQNTNIHKRGNLSFERPSQLDAEGKLQLHTCKSSSLKNSDTAGQKVVPKMSTSGNDESKAQLLKALRHSQTRAREAENAAKQAFAEKEHVVQLVFRQASQLFAYKQWFQLLQLENFYFQIKSNKKHPISAMLPVMLPRVPKKSKRPQKKSARVKRAKRGRPRYDLSRYAVVFALGLGLVGAGLLLGWTVGWMVPTF
ncbi:uncharacterized protein [Solanum lycopersicum]|nr:uncharacterized protein LOC101256522 isoform X2 [Solanum lycopersicum]XP_004229997.1 uncharacterized protein LOC101256522 isoform X2 [Solanum lycopersicum]XP_010327160.1 uncharacterized protein LOC101256522 isoform X2 [Solanum lycopersicum]